MDPHLRSVQDQVPRELENRLDVELLQPGIVQLQLRHGHLLVETSDVFLVGLAVDRLLIDEDLVDTILAGLQVLRPALECRATLGHVAAPIPPDIEDDR
ncbi:MAG TPA: hypothetical protein VHB47_22880 [Thermoanaerobaculia bacterium]|nr:hypothetical protein [Thermoanaerobaculia bacterium]